MGVGREWKGEKWGREGGITDDMGHYGKKWEGKWYNEEKRLGWKKKSIGKENGVR